MKNTRKTTGNDFEGFAILSPQQLGDGDKNQDRGAWLPTLHVACVCDGVSSSPNGAEAAELAVQLSPALFETPATDALKTLGGLLDARRRELQGAPILLPENTSAAMRPHLRDAIRSRRRHAFQTTLVAARFTRDGGTTLVDHVLCGDSALFAFSPNGQVLFDSRARPDAASGTGDMRFGPSDELLVKIVGTAREHPELAKLAQIQPMHARHWLACHPLDQYEPRNTARRRDDLPSVRLTRGDCLFVPRFYLGAGTIEPYRKLRYSSCIRMGAAPRVPTEKTNVTAVLPDHVDQSRVQTGDRFPIDTIFALASDGFYECFPDAETLTSWLIEHGDELRDAGSSSTLMTELHARLEQSRGDDDMSLVLVRPTVAPASGEA